MKCVNKVKRRNLFFPKPLAVFPNIASTIVIIIITNASLLIASEQNQQDSITIRNDEYRFEVTIP